MVLIKIFEIILNYINILNKNVFYKDIILENFKIFTLKVFSQTFFLRAQACVSVKQVDKCEVLKISYCHLSARPGQRSKVRRHKLLSIIKDTF